MMLFPKEYQFITETLEKEVQEDGGLPAVSSEQISELTRIRK